MSDETQPSKPKEICFQMRLNIPNLDQILPAPQFEPVQEVHHAHLVIDGLKSINLKIYHPDKDYLGDKLARWMGDQEGYLALTKSIEVVSINEQEDVSIIDFSESRDTTFSLSTAHYENGQRYFLVGLDSVRLVFKPRERETLPVSEFYLNAAAKKIIEEMYAYHGFTPFHGEDVWKAHHYHGEYQNFGNVQYRLDYHFYSRQSPATDTYVIHKEPRLLIQHENLPESDVLHHANLICALLSFYAQERISFDFARIHLPEHTVTITRRAEEVIPRKGMRLWHLDFHGKIFDLLRSVDYQAISPKSDFVIRLIDKYNLCYLVSGETEFLILFNILEQLRSDSGGKEKERDKYRFIPPEKEVDEAIQARIREIAPMVDESERALFLEQAPRQYLNLKRKPMHDQFERLFQHYQVNWSGAKVSFKDIKKLRDDIVHGGLLAGKHKKIEDANEVMRVLCGKLILQMVGIPDIRFGKSPEPVA